ncbi:MAG: hypothetical protein WD734_03615 [Dehalococcoidia bacterium]
MDLLHLVDRLEELVASAQKMPIGNRAIIDRRRLLDIIDQMRIAVPQEVRDAQDIVAHRDSLRREAEEEGRILIAQAEERAARLVEAHEVTVAARRRAEEIAVEAETRLGQRIDEANADIQRRIQESRQIAREQMGAADDYSRELLQRLERQLDAFVSSVQAGIHQLQPEQDAYQYAPRQRPEPGTDTVDHATRADREDETPATDSRQSEGRTPIPLRRDEDDDELENLLRPRRREMPRPPSVIDDFEHEPLDDDPMLTRLDEEEGDERR